MRWFANNFREWPSHSWKLLMKHPTRDNTYLWQLICYSLFCRSCAACYHVILDNNISGIDALKFHLWQKLHISARATVCGFKNFMSSNIYIYWYHKIAENIRKTKNMRSRYHNKQAHICESQKLKTFSQWKQEFFLDKNNSFSPNGLSSMLLC